MYQKYPKIDKTKYRSLSEASPRAKIITHMGSNLRVTLIIAMTSNISTTLRSEHHTELFSWWFYPLDSQNSDVS